jgi:septal ring factor EnvC (AmiA/AmiB activator)
MKKLYKLYLEFKKISEAQKKRELFLFMMKRKEKENEIASLESEKSKIYSELEKNLMEEGISPLYISQFLNYINGLRDEKKRKFEELRELVHQEEMKRMEYIDSKKEADLAQRLFYRVLMNEINQKAKQQEKLADEMAIIKKAFSESDENI